MRTQNRLYRFLSVGIVTLLTSAVATIGPIAGAGATTVNPAVTIAGQVSGGPLFNSDPITMVSALLAYLFLPSDVAVLTSGDKLIADTYHHQVRRVDSTGNIFAYSGDGAPGCEVGINLNQPRGVVSDGAGGAFISNTMCGLVVHVAVDGTTSVVAGVVNGSWYNSNITPGMLATDAYLSQPSGLAYDTVSGKLYIADTFSQRVLIVSAGLIYTVAGNQSNGYSGDTGQATAAQLNYPTDVAVHNGSVYIADTNNGAIRVVDQNGVISSLPLNHLGQLYPTGLTFDPAGSLYVAYQHSGFVSQIDLATNNEVAVAPPVDDNLGGIDFDTAGNLFVSGSMRVFEIAGAYALPAPKQLSYVALGDSVAAGEGILYGWKWDGKKWVGPTTTNPVWEPAADLSAVNQDCHRSLAGYPQLVSASKNYTLVDLACTSATAAKGVLGDQPFAAPQVPATVPAQLGTLDNSAAPASSVFRNARPDIVSLTLGADDVGFSDIVKKCYIPNTRCGTKSDTTALAAKFKLQQANLATVISELNKESADLNIRPIVVVTDYYDPFPDVGTNCIDTQAVKKIIGITDAERTWLKAQLANLNSGIRTIVESSKTASQNIDLRFVELAETATSTNVMIGHQYCSTTPWVYGPSIRYPIYVPGSPGATTNPAPFHPTPEGQSAIAYRVLAAL